MKIFVSMNKEYIVTKDRIQHVHDANTPTFLRPDIYEFTQACLCNLDNNLFVKTFPLVMR